METTKEFAEQYRTVFGRISQEALCVKKKDLNHFDSLYNIRMVLEGVSDFCRKQPDALVDKINEIKNQFKGKRFESDINELCDSFLQLYIDVLPHRDALRDICKAWDNIDSDVNDL